jgi:hypothetical protein
MSLTKKDFQNIGTLLDTKLDKRFQDQEKMLDSKLNSKFDIIKKELMAHTKKQIRPLNKKFDLVIKYFDKVTTKHDIRIKRVENELHLPPMLD